MSLHPSALVLPPFLVIPALDLLRGRAVKLRSVQPGTETDYGEPLRWLEEWERAGAARVMVFDLDAHFGSGENGEVLRRIVSSLGPRTEILVGGGLGSRRAAALWLDLDARVRVLLGDAASRDPELVRSVAGTYGRHRLYLGMNYREGSDIAELIARANDLGPSAAGVIVTDLRRDATGAGLDMDLFRALRREVRAPLIAAGGLARKGEVRELRAMGAAGVVVGRALFERRFTLKELLREAQT